MESETGLAMVQATVLVTVLDMGSEIRLVAVSATKSETGSTAVLATVLTTV